MTRKGDSALGKEPLEGTGDWWRGFQRFAFGAEAHVDFKKGLKRFVDSFSTT